MLRPLVRFRGPQSAIVVCGATHIPVLHAIPQYATCIENLGVEDFQAELLEIQESTATSKAFVLRE